MISARPRGLPAIAVPGDHAWEAEWAQLLAGRRVSIVMDCDDPGREAARRITGDLKDIGGERELHHRPRSPPAGWL